MATEAREKIFGENTDKAKEEKAKKAKEMQSEEEGVQNTSGSEKAKENEKALLGNSRRTLFGN